jgi:hypothetical protein
MLPKIVFCTRCRGMRKGCNKRYILHWLLCTQWFRNSSRLRSLAIVTAALLLAFPKSATVSSSDRPEQPIPEARVRASIRVTSAGPAVRLIDSFLEHHEVP